MIPTTQGRESGGSPFSVGRETLGSKVKIKQNKQKETIFLRFLGTSGQPLKWKMRDYCLLRTNEDRYDGGEVIGVKKVLLCIEKSRSQYPYRN